MRGCEGCRSLLIEVRPDVNDEHHHEEHAPARECAETAREARLIEEHAYAEGAEDLRRPVDKVIQCTRPDREQRQIVVVELCGGRSA